MLNKFAGLRVGSRLSRQEVVKLRDSRKPRRGLKDGVTTAPESSDPGFRAFVEENVKNTVKALKTQSILRSVRIFPTD